MKIRIFCKDCFINEGKGLFWIECTDNEVIEKILPHKSDKEFIDKVKMNKGSSKINPNENEKIYCNFFLISTDLHFIESYNWVYPYGGMWNAGNPFVEIEPLEINDLEELNKIQVTIKYER
jgi:hypothetical protein